MRFFWITRYSVWRQPSPSYSISLLLYRTFCTVSETVSRESSVHLTCNGLLDQSEVSVTCSSPSYVWLLIINKTLFCLVIKPAKLIHCSDTRMGCKLAPVLPFLKSRILYLDNTNWKYKKNIDNTHVHV